MFIRAPENFSETPWIPHPEGWGLLLLWWLGPPLAVLIGIVVALLA
jgi:hypothetical protein